jgi:surface polysaccharide O-acyltransferase-like enzyme
MTVAVHDAPYQDVARQTSDRVLERDAVIDTLRGIAILMVIGIHSLPKHDGSAFVIAIDAILRPCVPVFLFVSGYLTGQSGRIPLAKRIARALGPYTIAFVAAYVFMAVENPLIDNRPAIFIARYVLAYMFVYYYVFVYVGCTALLWIAFKSVSGNSKYRQQRLILLLSIAILVGLAIGAYLDPLLQRLGVSSSTIEQARMRDLPFWFGFMAVGTMLGSLRAEQMLYQLRAPLLGATGVAYVGYALVRILTLGDAADYDSIAFFIYAILFCLTSLAFAPRWRALCILGSVSYAIYLWHIFAIMLLRDHLQSLPWPATFLIEYAAALASSVVLVLAVRSAGPPRLAQWLGA